MDRKAAGLERNSRTVSGVLCRPHAGLTGCNRNVKSRDERRLTPLPLTSPRSAVIFVEKAAAACAAPALKYFCSILHHNLAFTQNLGLTPELLQEGYGEDTISQIRDGTIAELIRKSIFSRASLPSSELSELGYTESEIEYMKSLTGTETLADLSTRGILADCYTYNTFVSHTYNKSKDKTYFICNYGWEWDKCPNWVLTDCAGLGWNHDFHPDDAVDSDYNKTFKTYVNQGNASDKKYTTKHIYEKELQTAEDQFDMNGFYGSDYYVKSGSGTICLSQTGKVNDVKLSFKYGHNQFGPAVSVSYPWGVSFGLDGAETIFQPDEIVYNDFATVK